MLWSASPGVGYRPTAAWRARSEHGATVAIDDLFLAGFRDGGWIQECPSDPASEGWGFRLAAGLAGGAVVASP